MYTRISSLGMKNIRSYVKEKVYLCHLQVYHIKEKMKNRNKIVKLRYYFP